MYPTIFGYPSIWVLWGLALAVGAGGAVVMARRDGFSGLTSLGLVAFVVFIFLLGTKIHWWVMHPDEIQPAQPLGAVVRGFHLPGGLILTVIVVPIVLRLFGVPALRFLDAVVPVMGPTIVVVRIGCFLSGCCFGKICTLPWGVRFPPGSRAYLHHMDTHQLPADRVATAPLHPTQLYFAAAGLGIAAVLFWMRRRKRYDGQLLLWFMVMWGWSEVVIEAFRDHSVLGGTPYLWFTGLAVALVSTIALAAVTSKVRVGAVG